MADWRRTFYVIWFTQFVALAGFYFVIPFIPYYIQDLGIHEVGQVAMWSGLCAASTNLAMAVMAPIWGGLADRYGRKMMVLRATFAGAVVMTLMGFVVSAPQLLGLRLLQGALTGTVTASTTLVAGIVPSDRRGSVLGSLQTAVFLGSTLGPLLGGIVGDAFGYRQSFWITGVLLIISGVGVIFFVHERFEPAGSGNAATWFGSYGQAVRLMFGAGGALLAIFMARTLLRTGNYVTGSTLALFIQSLLPAGGHAALVTGLASGASAIGGAIGAPLIGGWGDRYGHRNLLIMSAAAAGLLLVPQAFVGSAPWLVFWQLLGGFAIGGTLSTATALLVEYTTPGHEGIVFGLDASASGLAQGFGPLLGASVAAGIGLRAPFLVAAGVMAAGTLVVVLYVRRAGVAPPAGSLPAVRPRFRWRT